MGKNINQIQIFELADQGEEVINTFLYDIQNIGAQIISTSISDGVVLIEYAISISEVKKAEEKNG